MDQSEVEKFVSDLVEEHWRERELPYLLSSVGLRIRRDFPNFQLPQGTGIREFCRSIPTVQVVTHPAIPQKIALVPASVPIPEDPASLFEASTKLRENIVYEDAFWRAFIRLPLKKRFVRIHSGESFEIVETEAIPSEPDCFEIKKSDISDVSDDLPIAEKAKITTKKIESWLQSNSLSPGIFAKNRREPVGHRRNDSALDRFLGAVKALSLEDQKRVSIPLDLICKMHDAR